MFRLLLETIKVSAYPLASRVHGREYYERLFLELSSALKCMGAEVKGVAESVEDALRVVDVSADAHVVVLLTGGTSAIARAVVEKVKGSPVALLAHPHHNSTASMASVKAKLEARGVRVHAAVYKGSIDVVAETLRVLRAAASLKRMVVAYVSAERPGSDAQLLAEKLGARVVHVPDEEVLRLAKSCDGLDVAELAPRLDLGGADLGALRETTKFYCAFKRVLEHHGAHGLAVDCFPMIEKAGIAPCPALALLLDEGIPAACEADCRSLVLLALSIALTGRPGWIGNVVDKAGSELLLAHCTVATSLTEYAALLPHFETGKPYAVHGRLCRGVYTLTAISPDYSRLVATKVEVVSSGALEGGMCRTQALLKVYESDGRPFWDKLVSNHHVLIPGDVRAPLRAVAHVLGMEYAEY